MPRDTLIDFFRDLVTIRGDFLVYDDGYRRRTHTYEDVGARRADLRRGSRPPACARATKSCSGARTVPNGSRATGAA